MDTFKVTFTPEKLKAFKAELAKHPDKDSTFEFEGKKWLVHYAQYLAAYLEGTFMAGRTEYKSNK